MSTPSTNVYVRPGWTSYTWTYGGTTTPDGAAIASVALDLASADGQQVARGDFQYSLDNGRSWSVYTLAVDQQGTWIPAAGTLWRFVDRMGGDTTNPGSFTMRWKLADGSMLANQGAVVVDNPPAGLVDNRDTVFSTLQAGDAVATLAPIDTGSPTGGRWVIDSQSQPGLFSIAASADGGAKVVIANSAAMPASGMGVTVNVHYYDRYQLDSGGNPIAGQGAGDTLTYTIVDGGTRDLPGFGADLALGASTGAASASPALATLSDGGFIAVWQGPDQGGSGVFAQLRDAAGAARGQVFAIAAGAAIEGEPAVTALAGGRFAVAYSVAGAGGTHVAYRIVEADGAVGAELQAGSAADAAMPALATLADGSFVLAWRSGGAVHTLQAGAATGAPLGAEHVTAALGSAFNPSVAALHGGAYVLSWGEMADGNVYAAIGASGTPMAVTADGAAASIQTAAPLAHVTALAGGGFVVAWDSYSNDLRAFSISDIFFQRYDDAGNRVGATVQANIDSGSGRFDAAVAALSDGGFVVTWQAQGTDYDANGVFGRRFGADGAALDQHEFEVNALRQGDQASPAVTALAGGGFATAWVDTQAGAGATIEARVLAGGQPAPLVSSMSTGQGAAVGAGAPAPAPSTATAGTTAQASPAPVAHLTGSAGNNAFVLGAGNNAVDGQGGLDTVVFGAGRAGFTVAHGAGGFTVSDSKGGQATLVDVERIQFSDATVALDIAGAAGQAYRLYQAAFDRVPDQAGLGFWIKAMDNGATLEQVAAQFEGSREFAELYGASTTNDQFIQLVYQNVLHRPAEGAGYDYWMDAMAHHNLPRTQMLGFFSESAENQAQVIGAIDNGITFIPWG